MAALAVMFSPVTPLLIQAAELPLAYELDSQKMREVVEAAPQIRSWLDSVEEAAVRRIEGGIPIDGLKLVHGRGSRSWSMDDDTVADKLTMMKVPKAKIWQTSLISVAQLDKLTWTNKKGENKSLTTKQKDVVKSEFVATSKGALKVVSAADPRPAVEIQKVEELVVPSWLVC
jgi:hypothetical protein